MGTSTVGGSNGQARLDNPADTTIGIAFLISIVMILWSGIQTGGAGLPAVPRAIMALALVVAMFGHMLKHLGGKLASAYLVLATVVEWAFEQANISFGGFLWGDLRYGQVLGPHLGDVPLLVPIGMAVLLWPVYVIINVVLDGKIVVNPRSLRSWQVVWHCVLYGVLHASIAFLANGFCTEFGIYEWVGKSKALAPEDSFFGDPALPLGWTIWGFVITMILSLVLIPALGRDALDRSTARPPSWVGAGPILLFGSWAISLFLNPVNQSVGSVTLFMFGFVTLVAMYRFTAVMVEPGQPLRTS